MMAVFLAELSVALEDDTRLKEMTSAQVTPVGRLRTEFTIGSSVRSNRDGTRI